MITMKPTLLTAAVWVVLWIGATSSSVFDANAAPIPVPETKQVALASEGAIATQSSMSHGGEAILAIDWSTNKAQEVEQTTVAVKMDDTSFVALDSIESPNKKFSLVFQDDGNLVLYDKTSENNAAVWNTDTFCPKCSDRANSLIFQVDGNVVLYNEYTQAKWALGSSMKGLLFFLTNGGVMGLIQKDNYNSNEPGKMLELYLCDYLLDGNTADFKFVQNFYSLNNGQELSGVDIGNIDLAADNDMAQFSIPSNLVASNVSWLSAPLANWMRNVEKERAADCYDGLQKIKIDGSLYNGRTFRTLVSNCYRKPDRDKKGCPKFLFNSKLSSWDVSEGKTLIYCRFILCLLLLSNCLFFQ